MSILKAQLVHLSRLVASKHPTEEMTESVLLLDSEIARQAENCRKIRITEADILSAIRFGKVLANEQKT